MVKITISPKFHEALERQNTHPGDKAQACCSSLTVLQIIGGLLLNHFLGILQENT